MIAPPGAQPHRTRGHAPNRVCTAPDSNLETALIYLAVNAGPELKRQIGIWNNLGGPPSNVVNLLRDHARMCRQAANAIEKGACQ